jgi:hypothetical protein
MRANEPEELNAFESRLAAWRPASDGLDADRLMFRAGRASVRGRLAWPAAAVSLALVSLCLGQRLLSERAQHWTDNLAMQSRIDLLTQSVAPQSSASQVAARADLPGTETATYRAGDLNLTDNVPQMASSSLVEAPDSKPLRVWQLDQALER